MYASVAKYPQTKIKESLATPATSYVHGVPTANRAPTLRQTFKEKYKRLATHVAENRTFVLEHPSRTDATAQHHDPDHDMHDMRDKRDVCCHPVSSHRPQ